MSALTTKSMEVNPMSSSPSQRMKIGDFLLRRLEDAGAPSTCSVFPATTTSRYRSSLWTPARLNGLAHAMS